MGKTFDSDIPGKRSESRYLDPVAAVDATESQAIFVAPFRCILRNILILADAAVTGNTTNSKNLNVVNRGTDGLGSTELANLDLITGVNLVAFDERQVNASELSTDISEGSVLALQIEQVGTGVAIPKSAIRVEFEPAGVGV